MLPDDDTLWFPGVAEYIMRIYERDEHHLIGGVFPSNSQEPPHGILDPSEDHYKMTLPDRMKLLIRPVRRYLENRFLTDPLIVLGRNLHQEVEQPGWLAEEKAVILDYMTGLCMTYRSELIRKNGYNERLGRYAVCEDIDPLFRSRARVICLWAQGAPEHSTFVRQVVEPAAWSME